MKEKASIVFRRLASGEVIGEIINSEGVVAESKNFGMMTEEEFRKIDALIRPEFQGSLSPGPMDLSGN